eukprot:Phypoly_transcript_05918.p1 GENE.Phypoly_transcript_05918~~Phypoly_transcript_05918.p1  ORF type:complete len:585 (+),score=99.29 Phypoly_transcript_05918:109-1863(+)
MNILITAGLCWLVFFIFLKYLEISYPDKTYAVLDKIQVSVSLFYVRWRTTSLNRFFHSVGTRGKNALKHWFFVGVVFGLVGMVASVALLICNIFFVAFLWKSQAQKVNGVLTPVIPGVNVPTSHMGYYVFALLAAGILHEFGHAFAAVSEKCKINAFGMFIMGVYPGAYVDIGEGLSKLSPLSQLRIYCGGAWHNAVVAAVCCLILFCLPQLVSPLYIYGTDGPYVMSVHPQSVFKTRVTHGDVITGIGGCVTKTVRDFETCIVKSFSLLGNHSLGYCLKDGYLEDYGTETFECFDSGYEGQLQGFVSGNEVGKHYCLVASEVMQYPECAANEDTYGCQCVFPRLAPDVALLQLHVKPKKGGGVGGQANGQLHITFVGTPQELWYSFTVRDYIFRFESLSFLDIDLPYILDKSLRYLASISAALAMLNMAPVYYLDGEWCLRPFLALLESLLGLTLLTRPSLSLPSTTPPSSPPASPPASPPLSLRSSHLSPSLSPRSSTSPPSPGFHFITNMDDAGGTERFEKYDKFEFSNSDSEKFDKIEKEDAWGMAKTREEDPLIKGILRVVSALFIVNIGLSFINLATT